MAKIAIGRVGEGKAPAVKRRGGRASRQKGDRVEREFAALTGGKRVPASGMYKAAGREFSEDVVLPNDWRVQCKAKADGWVSLYHYLETADILALKADRKTFLVVLTADRFMELFGEYCEHHGYHKEG